MWFLYRVLEAQWAAKGGAQDRSDLLPFSHLSAGLDRGHAAKLFYQMCGELCSKNHTVSPNFSILVKKHLRALELQMLPGTGQGVTD